MNTHLVYPLFQVYRVIFLCSHQGTAWQEYNCRMAYTTKTTRAMNQSFKSVFWFDLIWRIHSESGFFLHFLLNFSILDSRITSDGQKSWDFLFPSKSLAALNTDDWVSPYPPWPTDYKPLTFIDPCSSKQKIHPAITSPPSPPTNISSPELVYWNDIDFLRRLKLKKAVKFKKYFDQYCYVLLFYSNYKSSEYKPAPVYKPLRSCLSPGLIIGSLRYVGKEIIETCIRKKCHSLQVISSKMPWL